MAETPMVSTILRFALISLALVVLGHFLILQRQESGPTPELTVRGDTRHYVTMIEKGPSSAEAPFRYRVLAPWLAELAPVSALDGLRLISYVSLFGCYFLALWIMRLKGLDLFSSFIGLFAVYSSPHLLYYFHNPFLTDGLGLLFLFLLLFLFELGFFVPFLVAGSAGVLARESTLFLVPLWISRAEWPKALAAVLVPAAVFLLVRHILGSGEGSFQEYLLHPLRIDRLRDPVGFGLRILLSWRSIWFFSILGALLMPTEHFFKYVFAFLLLFAGAFVSCIYAMDLGRLFSILAPVMAVFCAYLFSELKEHSRVLAGVMVALLIAQLFMGWPTILTPPESFVFADKLPRLVLLIAGAVLSAVSVYILRAGLKRSVCEKHEELKEKLSRAKERFKADPPS